MAELQKLITQSFREEPLETLDILAQTLRELNIYITHDDNEELGRQARLGVWQKVFVSHTDIWRWVLFLADPGLLYWQGNGNDDEYPTRFPSTITEQSTTATEDTIDDDDDIDDRSNNNFPPPSRHNGNNNRNGVRKGYRLSTSFLSIILLTMVLWIL